MAEFVCYVDKESSTFFDTKLRDKKSGKKVIIKAISPGRKMTYKYFSVFHSSDKGITEKDGKVEIIVNGIVKKETKSAIFLSIDGAEGKFRIHKIKD